MKIKIVKTEQYTLDTESEDWKELFEWIKKYDSKNALPSSYSELCNYLSNPNATYDLFDILFDYTPYCEHCKFELMED